MDEFDNVVPLFNDLQGESPDPATLPEDLEPITLANVTEMIATTLDGLYDDDLEVFVSASNTRRTVYISIMDDVRGTKKYIATVKVDNAS